MKAAAAFALVLAGSASAMQGAPLSAPLQAESRIEADLSADFDGDGTPDRAYIVRSDDAARELRVVLGQRPPQVLALPSYPLADADLTLAGNVLLLRDLNGGTTAVSSTHRFRWDKRLRAMRLIGLDATLYSRTFAHDGRKASWNLLTGDLLTHTLQLRSDDSDAAYDEVNKQRRKKRSRPLRLEQSPDGDDLIGWPGGR